MERSKSVGISFDGFKFGLLKSLWLISLAGTNTVMAAQNDFPRALKDIRANSTEEVAHRVSSAQLFAVNLNLIRRDFPQTASLSDAELETWLLDNTAYLSGPQVAQTGVNSAVTVDGRTRTARRFVGYGRGYVLEMRKDPANPASEVVGILASKGSGAATAPRITPDMHKTGLMTMEDALREWITEEWVSHVLAKTGNGQTTVGNYGIIDLGFEAKLPGDATSPSVLLLRQPHNRIGEYFSNHFLPEKDAYELEMLLRQFGLTSTKFMPMNSTGTEARGYRVADIQGTPTKDIFDFGTYRLADPSTLNRPLLHYPHGYMLYQLGNLGLSDRQLALWAMNPEPGSQLPESAVLRNFLMPTEEGDAIANYIHQIVSAYRSGRMNRATLENSLKETLTLIKTEIDRSPLRPIPPYESRTERTLRFLREGRITEEEVAQAIRVLKHIERIDANRGIFYTSTIDDIHLIEDMLNHGSARIREAALGVVRHWNISKDTAVFVPHPNAIDPFYGRYVTERVFPLTRPDQNSSCPGLFQQL